MTTPLTPRPQEGQQEPQAVSPPASGGGATAPDATDDPYPPSPWRADNGLPQSRRAADAPPPPAPEPAAEAVTEEELREIEVAVGAQSVRWGFVVWCERLVAEVRRLRRAADAPPSGGGEAVRAEVEAGTKLPLELMRRVMNGGSSRGGMGDFVLRWNPYECRWEARFDWSDNKPLTGYSEEWERPDIAIRYAAKRMGVIDAAPPAPARPAPDPTAGDRLSVHVGPDGEEVYSYGGRRLRPDAEVLAGLTEEEKRRHSLEAAPPGEWPKVKPPLPPGVSAETAGKGEVTK